MKMCECGKPETRYEVKIKTQVKEYFICWPCYDEQLAKEAHHAGASTK